MRLLKATAQQFTFRLDEREKDILLRLLELYPLIPAAHQSLSKKPSRSDGQQLLDEALAAQRQENKRWVQTMLKTETIFHDQPEGAQLLLKHAQVEVLLQVLNDVRVGSWLVLGSPDGPEETVVALSPKTAPYLGVLELAGHFQMALLNAVSVGKANQPSKE